MTVSNPSHRWIARQPTPTWLHPSFSIFRFSTERPGPRQADTVGHLCCRLGRPHALHCNGPDVMADLLSGRVVGAAVCLTNRIRASPEYFTCAQKVSARSPCSSPQLSPHRRRHFIISNPPFIYRFATGSMFVSRR